MANVPTKHPLLGNPLEGPYPSHLKILDVGMGCFWGAERKFYKLNGVYTTAVGYQGGYTPNPTYEEVCSGRTGHTEAVRIVFDPSVITTKDLLKIFWEAHNPTTQNQSGNDRGTQYRSAIYTHSDEDLQLALASKESYEKALGKTVWTEIKPADPFYFAEDYHQQYLHHNPGGYCSMKGTGVECVI